jgi:hypothetical protein
MGWYDRITTSKSASRWESDETGDSLDRGWSPSKSVSNFFGDSSTVHTTDKNKYSQILAELNRTCNLLVSGGFSVKYSDGSEESGKIDRKSMNVSPDILLTDGGHLKSGSSYFDALDALNGRVILGTHIRNNISDQDFDTFTKSGDNVAKSVFQTVQQFSSIEKIKSEWKGFRPYLQAHQDATQSSKASIKVPTDLTEDQLPAIMQAANWNLAYPDNPIEIENVEVKEAIDGFLDKVSDQFQDCVDAANYLRGMLKKTSPKGGDGKGDGKESKGKDSSGGGSSSGEPKEEGTPKPKRKDLTPFDSEVFNDERVETSKPEIHHMRGEEGADECNLEALKVVVDRNVNRQTYWNDGQKKEAYKQFLLNNRKEIKEVEKCFLFQENQSALFSRGLSVGDIDEGNLHKVGFDPEFIYERKDIPKQMEHQVGILLDQSGSMGGTKMKEARNVVITLMEGLRSYKSISQIIYGHTGQENDETECTLIPYKDGEIDNTLHLIDAPARLQNIDGLAIKYVADQMLKKQVDGKRIMLVISDGSPAGYGYGGASGCAHTLRACNAARRKGIVVFGIGICNAFSPETGKAIYGAGNFVVIRNTKDSLKIMTNRLKKLVASI